MFKFIQTGLFCGLLLTLTGCTRSFEKTATVSLSIPQLNKMSTASTCTTTCLKSIVIKIEGPGFEKIIKKISASNIRDASEVTGDYSFDIPIGDNRTFKVAAIYVLAGKHILAYAETNVNLPDTTAKSVELAMVNKGQIHGGSLVGRYITGISNGADTGPTGAVDITLNYNSDPDFDMHIEQGQILNGWFDLMASEDLEMTYKVSGTNDILFEKQSLNKLVPLNGGLLVPNIGRIVRPASYYKRDGNLWKLEDEKHDIVYGFFSPVAANVSGKTVCFQDPSTAIPLSNMSSTASGVPTLSYTTTGTSGIYPLGGDTTCGSSTADRFTADKIYVNSEQLNGNGNDTAKGFGNAFTYITKYISPNFSVQKYQYSNSTFTLKNLPGLFGSGELFDNIQLYKKANSADGGVDDLQCKEDWLASNGFNLLPASTSFSSDTTYFQINGAISSSDGTVACPIKNNTLQIHGGFYLGGLKFSKLEATPSSIAFDGSNSTTLEIKNTGTEPTTITFALSTPTGQFTYANVDCSTMLAAGATCTMAISYAATATSADASLTVNYDNYSQQIFVPIHGDQ